MRTKESTTRQAVTLMAVFGTTVFVLAALAAVVLLQLVH